MKKSFTAAGIATCVMLLMTGCAPTLRPTKLPYFLEKLDQHQFSPEEKRTLGEILHYINDLENDAH